jgi:hypothetical protein
MRISDILSEVEKSGEVVELYDTSHVPTTFAVGRVEGITQGCVVLRMLTQDGEDDGAASIMIDQVAAIGRNSLYLSRIARLIELRGDNDRMEPLAESDVHSLQEVLASACRTGEVVTLTMAWESDEPGNNVTGTVLAIEGESARLHLLSDEGTDDGTLTVLLKYVVQIRWRQQEHRLLTLLSRPSD